MALENLVNVQGQLKGTFPQLDPSTIQSSAQIMKDRHDDSNLRNKWFWTADSALYRVERGQEVLYLGGLDTNLVFRNLNEAVDQLLQTQNYKPNKQDIQSVVEASKQGKASRVMLSDLGLKTENDEFCYYEIDTENYNNSVKKGGLNKAQRAVAEQIYGSGKDFDARMEDLNKVGISKTRVWVLNPKYVKANVGEDNGIARACWLNVFVDDSRFYADSRSFDISIGFVRGVRKEVAEGDASKKTREHPCISAYQALMANPNLAIEMMTPEIASGVSGILTGYLNKQKQ